MHPYSVVCLVLFAHVIGALKVTPNVEGDREMFGQFKRTYKKNYANEAESKRFAIFRDNLKRAAEYQKHDMGTAIYGVTEFSDLTADEFRTLYANTRFDSNVKRSNPSLSKNVNVPESIDWRELGAVGPVKTQGDCGSCWAFSVIGNIEGQWFRKTGKLLTLSEQQVVDCDVVDKGCGGGWPPKTYGEISRFGGLELATDYPYEAFHSHCRMESRKFKAYVNGSFTFPKDEEKQYQWMAQHGPIASTLNAISLQFYQSGIMHLNQEYCPSEFLNHAVLSVGYGEEQQVPYWIVKNSWGTKFGESGYFRIHRGDSTCGIDQLCSTAVIS